MIKIFGLIFILQVLLMGCATKPTPAPLPVVTTPPPAAPAPVAAEPAPAPESEKLTKFSEVNNMPAPSDRSYKRMTRQRMEEESDLQASAGSLWKMDGQTSYLFQQNKHRVEGDPTTIKMEGLALKEVETKVAVIQDLMKDLEKQKVEAEEQQKKADEEKARLAEIEKNKPKIITDPNDPLYDPYAGQYPADIQAAEDAKLAASRKPAAIEKKPEVAKAEPKEEKIDLKDVETIPSRIVEKLANGMYRVSGQQVMMIKKKPYKVIATGLVRPEDFDDTAISSQKLLEPQYDVIHMKRTQ
jgi:flagellar L-ring protein precursor FlgH